MTYEISVACFWGRHDECTGRTNPEYICGVGPCRCIHHEPVHWAGDAPTSVRGSGASSFERTACFGHCEPDGWHRPCRKPSEREVLS